MTRLDKAAWGVFATLVVGVLLTSARALSKEPLPDVPGTYDTAGGRFGLSLEKRKEIYRAILKTEPSDRAAVANENEAAVWNRNRDDFFHQKEASRINGIAVAFHIPRYQAYLILDEGMRAHWDPPPGVEIRYDDAPLAKKTRPWNERPIFLPAPGAPK